jgi:hypothetical protein
LVAVNILWPLQEEGGGGKTEELEEDKHISAQSGVII